MEANIEFKDLSVGTQVQAYGKTWEVKHLSNVEPRVFLTRLNESGKQMAASLWVEPDEIDVVRSGQPCDQFRFDYYLDEQHRGPNARYCVCGWTEAHHVKHCCDCGEPFTGSGRRCVPCNVVKHFG